MPGRNAAAGRELDKGELAVGRGLEGDEGVAGDLGAVLLVWVFEGELGEVAVAADDELVVRGDGELGGAGARRVARVGAEGALVVDLREGDFALGVGHLVAGHAALELVDDEEVRVLAGLPEGGVAGTVARGELDVVVRGELVRLGVNAEDVHGIETEIGEDEVLAGGVQDGVVHVRAIGLLGLGALGGVGVLELLDERELAALEGVRCNRAGAVMSDGDGLLVVVELDGHRAAKDIEAGVELEVAVFASGDGADGGVGCPRLVDDNHLSAAERGIQPGRLRTGAVESVDDLERASA